MVKSSGFDESWHAGITRRFKASVSAENSGVGGGYGAKHQARGMGCKEPHLRSPHQIFSFVADSNQVRHLEEMARVDPGERASAGQMFGQAVQAWKKKTTNRTSTRPSIKPASPPVLRTAITSLLPPSGAGRRLAPDAVRGRGQQGRSTASRLVRQHRQDASPISPTPSNMD